MAKDETKRLAPGILQEDRDSIAALKTITNYSPANQEFTQEKLDTAEAEMLEAQRLEAQAYAALAAARDNATAKEWACHNKVLGMRDQVVAQFGRNSNQAQSVGRKKPSEFRKKSSKKS